MIFDNICLKCNIPKQLLVDKHILFPFVRVHVPVKLTLTGSFFIALDRIKGKHRGKISVLSDKFFQLLPVDLEHLSDRKRIVGRKAAFL